MIALLIPLLLAGAHPAQGERRGVPPAPAPAPVPHAPLPAGMQLRLYDLAELTGHRRLEPLLAGLVDTADPLDVALARERLAQLEAVAAQAESMTTSLLELIRERMEPAFDDGVNTLKHLQAGTLALFGHERQHEWLQEFLASAESFRGMVALQVLIYTLEPDAFAELDPVRHGPLLSETQSVQLLAEIDATGAERVQAPRVVTAPFRKAQLSIGKQVAYIESYELKVFPDQDLEVADPVIGVVHSGLELDVRAIPLATGKLGVYARFDHAALAEPIPTAQVSVGDHDVTIQRPDVTRVQVQGHFDVFPGQTVLLSSSDPLSGAQILVFLHVSHAPANDEPRPR